MFRYCFLLLTLLFPASLSAQSGNKLYEWVVKGDGNLEKWRADDRNFLDWLREYHDVADEKVTDSPYKDDQHALDMADQYIRDGRILELEDPLKFAVEFREKRLGKEHSNAVHLLDQLAIFYHSRGRYAEAEPLYKRVLEIREKQLPGDHPNIPKAQRRLALLHKDQGRYAESETLYKRALELYEKQPDKNSFDGIAIPLATTLHGLAMLHESQGRDAEAKSFSGRACDTLANIRDENHHNIMVALNDTARFHDKYGDYAISEPLYMLALDFSEKYLSEKQVLTILYNLAVLYEERYGYKEPETEQLYKRALEICEEQQGQEHLNTARLLNHLALLYVNQGRYTEAEPLFKRAARISITRYQDRYTDSNPLTKKYREIIVLFVTYLENLASLFAIQGRYAEAEQLYKNVLEMHQENLDGILTSGNAMPTVGALVRLYTAQGRYAEAEEYCKDVLYFRVSLYGIYSPSMMMLMENLAFLYQNQKRFADAELLLKIVLNFHENRRNQRTTALSLDNLAELYRIQGRYTESEPLYKRALAIRETQFGKTHPVTASSLNHLASLYTDQGRYAVAEPLLNQAITIFEANPASADDGQLWYQNRANLRKATNRSKEALVDLKRAMDLSLEVRKHASDSDEQRALTFAQYYELFETMVDWQYKLGDLNEAYDAMERSRAQGLQDLVNTSGIDLLEGVPEATAQTLRYKESAALAELASCERKLELEPNRTDLVQSWKTARKELLDARAAIRSASPSYRLMIAGDRKPVALDVVRKELVAEKSLALEYLLGGEKSYVLLYGADTQPRLLPLVLNDKQATLFHVESGPLTAKKLETILQNEKNDGVLQHIGNPKNTGTGTPDAKTLDKLTILWMVLVPDKQIRTKLVDGKSFKQLVILPDGALARFPFESLVVEPDTVNVKYLLDVGPTTLYAPSASMYYNLKRRKVEVEVDKAKILTVGNPDYAPKRSAKSTDKLIEMHNTRRAIRIGTLAPLPWTEKETEWIAQSCRKNGIAVTRFDLAQSTEENVRKNVSGRKIVHLACHGLAEGDAGNAMFSTLALTVGDPTDPKNDGFLELAEMFSLDLKSCELAVLSACETNLGPNQHGEGTWSMGRGMLASGAKRVVTTDWQVADDASAHLTYDFIDRVNESKTPDYATALQEAKRSIRNDREHPQWRHPYYWAPFVLIGPNY